MSSRSAPGRRTVRA